LSDEEPVGEERNMQLSKLRAPSVMAAVAAILAGALLLTSGAVDAKGKGATAGLNNVDGVSVGQVRFVPRDDEKVTVRVNASGLEPGWHGIHIHTAGICEPDAMDGETESPFFTAGAHWNPDETDHGTHPGDIPPLYANEDEKPRLPS
jgi:Cu-Zn family superoxide dismutase